MAKTECQVHAAEVNGFKRFLIGIAAALAVVLLTQTGALIWWASSTNIRVKHTEGDVARVETDIVRIVADCCP